MNNNMEKSNAILKSSQEFMNGKKKNLFFLLLIPVCTLVVFSLVEFLFKLSFDTNTAVLIIMTIVIIAAWAGRLVVDITTPFALIHYIDSAHQGTILSPINSYKIGWKRVFQGFMLIAVKGIIVVIGFIGLILPGIYLGFSLALANYAYMVRKKDVKSSFIYSFHIMQNNIGQFILKQLYLVGRILVLAIPTLLSFAVFLTSAISSTKQMWFILLAILGLAGFCFFGIKTIKLFLISQEYLYEVFTAIEKTKGEIKEEDLIISEKRLKKYLNISIILAAVVIVTIFTVFSVL